MKIRSVVSKLKKAGVNISVGYEKPNSQSSKDWCLYDYRVNPTRENPSPRPIGLCAYGRENVEGKLRSIAAENNILI